MKKFILFLGILNIFQLSAQVTASDCVDGVNVCTDINFTIEPNGEGSNTNEIPPPGSLGNPYYVGATPWGTTNMGCLQMGEFNSTWMYINISGSGDLEFTFGGNGTQAGFYDWIMYPAGAGCTDISSNSVAPVRCNWNGEDFGGTGLADVIPPGGDPTNFEPSLSVVAGEVYILCFSNYSSAETFVPLEFGGTATVSCSPLPIELIFFDAKNINDREVSLQWATASEVNNDFFTLERSINGFDWEIIKTTAGAGNSNVLLNYSETDKDPYNGISYYRLKQTDFDGNYEYSNIKSVNLNISEKGNLHIYPNPTNNVIYIAWSQIGLSEFEVINTLGQSVTEFVDITIQNESHLLIDLSNLSEGIYYLTTRNSTNKVIKQ